METLPLVSNLIAIFTIAFVGAWGAKKLGQPVLTGYLFAGLVATTLLGRFFSFENTQILADLGLAFLMFVVGLDFSFRRLNRVKGIAIVGAIAQMVLTTAVFWLVGHNLILAIVFSLSSTAIVVKLLAERGELDTLPSEIIVGWLLVQDLAVVPILAVLPIIIKGGTTSAIASGIFISLLKAAILLYLILLFGKKIFPRVLNKVAQVGSREVLLIAAVGLVLLSAAITFSLGLSFALGAFLAGLLVAETASQHAIFAEIRPLRDVFSVIFFVTLGVLVSPAFLLGNWLAVLAWVGLLILVKFLVTTLITLRFGYHGKTALQVGLALTQVGEFAFVIARLSLDGGLIGRDAYSLVLAVTILTMMLTPWQLRLSVGLFGTLKTFVSRWSPRLYKVFFSGFDHYQKDHEGNEWSRHIVICGHGRVGRHIARILAMASVPYVVVDYNHGVISELGATGVETVFGDPADREVLKFACVDKARVVVVAVPDRYSQELIIQNSLTLQPGVMIICRSHFEEDYKRLYALGASVVISPELEAGLSMGHRILDALGLDKAKTAVYLKQVRREQAI